MNTILSDRIRLAMCAVVAASACFAVEEKVEGLDTWAWNPRHPAVVNPVVPASSEVLSLRGEWDFMAETMGVPLRNGIWGSLLEEGRWAHARKIQVPGCWEAQGVGEPGPSECWDCKWDNNAKPIRHKYMGEGWYRRTVEIPAAWAGRRIWLKVGGVRAQGWFWVNGQQVACVNNYCGTYKYEITGQVKPGEKAQIVVQVDNRVPARKGQFNAFHKWGGIYRDLELEATPQTFIDEAWMRGEFDARQAEAHVEVRGFGPAADASFKIRVAVEGAQVEAEAKEGENVLRVPLKKFRAWSPEHPNLYTGVVELVRNGKVVQTRQERFGVRKLEVRGKEFRLNGKPFFIRGFGDDSVYPVTLAPSADRAVHREHLARAHAAGFNFVRLHTHCEVPEYFEAADECGILIQPELPYYSDVTAEAFIFDPVRDADELYRNYRRYPSFGVYSMGNEGSFGPRCNEALQRHIKVLDPDRLKIGQDCHEEAMNRPTWSDYRGGPIDVWPRGSLNPDRPFVTHEYLNLSVKLDSRLEPRFSGATLPPVTRSGRAAWLAKFGLDHTWGDRLQNAQHGLQRVYQKRGLEAARADPYCDGYIFWTIVDVIVQQGETYSAQGMFNPFWETKPNGFTPGEVARFNGPTAILLDTDPACRVCSAGDVVSADFLVSHQGEAPIPAGALEWSIVADGKTLARGTCPVDEIPLGAARRVASAKIAMPAVARGVEAELKVAVGGVENGWPIWIFPKRTLQDGRAIAVAEAFRPALAGLYRDLLSEEDAAKAEVVVAPWGSACAAEALARGQRVVTLAGCSGRPNVSLGWWWMGNQVGTAFLDGHPAFAKLPHRGFMNELFFRIVKDTGMKLPFAGLSQAGMLAVGEGGTDAFLYLAEGRVEKGSVLAGFGLDVLSGTPEGQALLEGLIDYARSDAFAPKDTLQMPKRRSWNGFGKVVSCGNTVRECRELQSVPGAVCLHSARAVAGQTDLVWETRPAPADARNRATCSFVFLGGMGYPQQPAAPFSLWVGDEKVIDIPEVVWKDATWKGRGCTLSYARLPDTDELGTFTLTVPAARVTPGKPLRLAVKTENRNSLRWLGVFE